MYNPFSLSGKTILVTGASSGIGRATAVECSRMGARVILTARSQERLEETLSLMDNREEHHIIVRDLGNEDAAKCLINALQVDNLDGVVHCAGISRRTMLPYLKSSDLEQILQTNLITPILLNKYLLKRKLLRSGSSIVLISSTAAYRPSPGLIAYAASKGGILSSMKSLSCDLFQKEIRVNAICPAMIETAMVREKSIFLTDELTEADKKKYFLNRYGKPEEVAYVVIYLLSDASQWITGNEYMVNGGMYV